MNNPQLNAREVLLAGAEHSDPYSDLKWTLMHPRGNWAIRTMGFLMRKAFRKGCTGITFDRDSFEQARAAVAPGSLIVLAPTHRSMMDFVVCSYLCFDHPELDIAIPYIAADLQIGGLPFLGWFLKQAHAFYLKRGQGGPDSELNQKIRQLVTDQQTLEVFIEGTRSRSRQCMKPKRGLLRALQQTGVPVALLPVSISYDRLPEEHALMKELHGAPKPLLSMKALLKWFVELGSGQVNVGRVHLACGEPVLLNKDSDVHAVSYAVMDRLQAKYVVTTFHLRAFLRHASIPELDLETLSQFIVSRGGSVLESSLDDGGVDALTELTYRNQWLHLFYSDLKALYSEHPGVQYHIEANSFGSVIPSEAATPVNKHLVDVLFGHLFTAYEKVITEVIQDKKIHFSKARHFVAQNPGCFLPMVEEAFTHLKEAQVLEQNEQFQLVSGVQWQAHRRYGSFSRQKTPRVTS